MLRILMINDRFGPGGAEQVAENLREGLIARGHQVRTMSATNDPDVEYRCWSTEAWFNPLVRLANPSAFLTLRRALQELRPHVVYVGMFLQQLSPLVLALLRDYPTLYYAHLYEANCPRGTRWLPGGSVCQARPGRACASECLSPQAWLALMGQRMLLRHWQGHLNEIIAVSYHLARSLEADGWSVAGVIHPGIRTPVYAPAPGSQPVVACVSRMVPEKGLDTLLLAFAQVVAGLPEARLWLVGDGPDQPRLAAIADNLELSQHILWLGTISREQTDQRLAAAWVQVVPSHWEEPFGLVGCEGAAMALPVVGSAVGGICEIVESGVTGILVEPGQPDPLAGALLELLLSPSLARAMGQRGLARFRQKFSVAGFVDQFEQRFCKLAQLNPGANHS